MTYAQFRRMKPMYRRRLVIAVVIAFALFAALMFGVSLGISAIRVQFNTKELKEVTAATVLQKENMAKILTTVKQDDAGNLLVMDSALTLGGDGKVSTLTLNFVNLMDKGTYENWRLVSTTKKTTLRKVSIKYENMNALRLRKVELKTYYPALSRIVCAQLLQYLEDNAPVGAGGSYTFTDTFGNNLTPEYESYISKDLTGIWVSKIGAVSEFNENFKPVAQCAPTIVTVHAVKTEKGKKPAPLDPVERFVVLLEAAPY
ncbi:hypothetical protein V6615_08025 [Oscillospiraceae bacterium PP1C4]